MSTMSSGARRVMPVALTAAFLSACADAPTTAVRSPSSPSQHLIPIDVPQRELVALCKSGPVGTYTFDATATHPVLRDATTGAYSLTAATYTIVVSAGSTIDDGGTIVPGACYTFTDANGTHNHIALVGGTVDATVTVVETGIPAGIDFDHVVVYQRTGPTIASSSSTTNSASGMAGGTPATPATLAANIVFYNVAEPPPASVLLIIDEDGIDNGLHYHGSGGLITPSGPNFFKIAEVNDDIPGKKQRDVLRFFASNENRLITVRTGQTGDEGWFAPNCIPAKWLPLASKDNNACQTNGNRQTAINNYFGVPSEANVPEQERLDKVPHVIPLRALGLNALIGKTVCAVVYDSDVGINYDHGTPLGVNGNLQGETLGIAAFDVVAVTTLSGFSSSTLPQVTIRIRSSSVCGTWALFNAPVPKSSSVPLDRLAPGSTYNYKSLTVWPAPTPIIY